MIAPTSPRPAHRRLSPDEPGPSTSIPRAVLAKLDGLSLMAHATLLRCYLLADDAGEARGLLARVKPWGMTKADVFDALDELAACGLVSVRWIGAYRGFRGQLVVTVGGVR